MSMVQIYNCYFNEIILSCGKQIIKFVQYSVVYKSATTVSETGMKNLLINIACFMQREQRSPLNGQILNKKLLEDQKSSVDQYYQKDKTEQQLAIFSKLLLQVPTRWVKLLYVDGIQTQTNQIILNSSSTISKMYQKLIRKWEDSAKFIRKEQEKLTPLRDLYINETCLALINQIFNLFAQLICDCFMDGRALLNSEVKKVDESIKKYQMMNSYIAFSLLKQISASTSITITQKIVQTFPQFSEKDFEQFCKYIQKNYQFIKLKSKDSGQNFIMTEEQLISYVNQKNSYWLDIIKNNEKNQIKVKKIQSTNGDQGILLVRQKGKQSNEKISDSNKKNIVKESKQKKMNSAEKGKEEESDEQKLIIKVENGTKIKVVNAKVCQQSWLIFQTKDSMTQIYENLKKQIDLNKQNSTKQYVSYGVPTCQYATIGGSLGKCLADINQYNSASQFFIDVSKTATICSTISYAMAQIPILSYFIIAGGFTYSFYIAYNNKATSTFKKVNQIGSYTMSAVGSVGSTLAGIMLGQVVIPVPFVGAFIGGVVGGFVGTKGVRDMNEFLARSQFRQIISYIKFKQIDKRYWKCTNHLLQRIGLNKEYFIRNTAGSQMSKDLQITAVCLCIITFYQSKRYLQYTNKKLKDHEVKEKQKQKERQKNVEKGNRNTSTDLQRERDIGVDVDVNQGLKQEEGDGEGEEEEGEGEEFTNQFDIVRIVDFLTQSQYSIYDHLETLQSFIRHFVV